MKKLLAKDIMVKKVITIGRDASIGELSNLLVNNKISGVPVVDSSGKILGIVTEADIIIKDADLHFPRYFKLLDGIIYLESFRKFKNNLKKYLGSRVEDIMTNKVKAVEEDAPVGDVASMMINNNVNRIPVVDKDKKVIGIITRRDIVKSMIVKEK
ncbi:MAG: CBS domain-containing protein [Acidobacteriota bacterium]|nr:CBS domain-containing protein [Acidobacteriota bacterium]